MLTRTVISPSTVEKIRMDPPTGKHMANYLRENGLLLINRDELDVLAEKLPNEIWIRLQDDIVKNRQARSPWIPGSEITQPEVALSESGSDAAQGAISTLVADYMQTFPVDKRINLKSGEETCHNREDFWKWLIEPAVASLPLRHRRVDIVDRYLFHHIHNEEKTSNGSLNATDLGIVWFLRELRRTTDSGSSILVNIYTVETSPVGNPCIDLARINQLCQQYLASASNDSFKIRVHVIRHRRKDEDDLRNAYHERRIFLNESWMFVLGKGLEDASKMIRGEYFCDRLSVATVHLRHANNLYRTEYVGVIRDKYFDVLWKDRPEYIITL